MAKKKRVGIAFQGGGFPAGALGAGAVRRLVEHGAFQSYEVAAFSGSSAGALVACACWGHTLRGTIREAPDLLERQWKHFAWGWVGRRQETQMTQLMDTISQMNPLYQYTADKVLVPMVRGFMRDWVLAYLPVGELVRLRDDVETTPGLALGTTDALTGESRVFSEADLCLDVVLAAGSIDESHGATTISKGRSAGTYCDGVWGTNPPIVPLIDYGIDELWLVESVPRHRETLPKTPTERATRKGELWQTLLVEQSLAGIERVNQWLASGKLDNSDRKYRQIQIKRMPMARDLPTGAAFAGSRTVIQEMMDYGYAAAAALLEA